MEPQQQFSLCWNNFQSNISAEFKSLWKEQHLVDVTLSVEGKCLQAHKMVLSICSPYFKDLFCGHPCKHPIVILHDIKIGALQNLLQYMYLGEVKVKQSELATFMKVAEALKIKGLTETDNNASASANREAVVNGLDKEQKLKAQQNKKPVVKPVQPIKGSTRRSASKSPPRPSAKVPKIEENRNAFVPVKVKEEPVEPDEGPPEDMTLTPQNSLHDDNSMPELPLVDGGNDSKDEKMSFQIPMSTDASSPGTLQCIIGRRGLPRLIVDGYTFFKKSTYKNKCFWYCKSNKTHKCSAVCWSVNGLIVKWPEAHTHASIPELIIPGEDKVVPIEILTKVLIECARRTGPELIALAKTF